MLQSWRDWSFRELSSLKLPNQPLIVIVPRMSERGQAPRQGLLQLWSRGSRGMPLPARPMCVRVRVSADVSSLENATSPESRVRSEGVATTAANKATL